MLVTDMAKTDVELAFERYAKVTKDPVAAALLVAAEAVNRIASNQTSIFAADVLSHAICLGLRNGLFGTGASDSSSITDGLVVSLDGHVEVSNRD